MKRVQPKHLRALRPTVMAIRLMHLHAQQLQQAIAVAIIVQTPAEEVIAQVHRQAPIAMPALLKVVVQIPFQAVIAAVAIPV